jgi:hypothetical protein
LQKAIKVIFIDPSELRETSNLKKYLADLPHLPLPDLEARTGADVMVSPSGLPRPVNDKLLAINIQQGAILIQVKFGQDIASSIVDGRLVEALSRMLKSRAQTWQAVLLYIGQLGYDSTQGMATIDGQLSLAEPPLTWNAVQAALMIWVKRGGSLDMPLPSGECVPMYLATHQKQLDLIKDGKDTRLIWPTKPAFYNEMETEAGTTLLEQWKAAQKVERIEDIRVLLCAIPDANIGPERATATLEYMRENGYREDFSGFMQLLDDNKFIKVPGIGKKIDSNARWGLWRTHKERQARKEAE